MTLALGVAALLAGPLNHGSPIRTIDLPLSAGSAQHIALHCAGPEGPTDKGVLFIHGSSFPTMLAAGFEFKPGDSWIEFMAQHGYLACGLDFLGFGASSRPQSLFETPAGKTPLLRAPEAAREINVAVTYLHDRRAMAQIHVIAHSWGTIPAAMFAAEFPSIPASLTMFGPIVPVPGASPEKIDFAWSNLSPQDRYEQLKFADVLPKGMDLLEPAVHKNWAVRFAESAPPEGKTADGDLRIPSGPLVDLDEAHAGIYPYSPDKVKCPIFAVYGDYDAEVNDTDAPAFLARFTASPLKWRLRIDHGTHVMHLEQNRHSLYASVYAFIEAAGR